MLLHLSAVLLIPACFLQTMALPSPTIGQVSFPERHDKSDITDPIPPSQDPWYTAPEYFEAAQPGTVMRLRQAPGNMTSLVANCSAAYNILYRTTNSHYRPAWAVTTVFVPNITAASLVSYQVPYDSASLDASPSYALYSTSNETAGYRDAVNILLSQGWFVNVPDYEGPLASFTAGIQSGHATIDSVRAVLGVKAWLGLADDARYAMWGYSGGALASEWAAELQVQYAPEMSFSGAAIGGLTPNVTSVLWTIDGTPKVGLAPSAILGLTSQWPEARDYFVSRLKTSGPHNATGFMAALNYTVKQASAVYASQNMGDYLVGGVNDLYNPISAKMLNLDGIMGYHGVPQMPLFVYKTIKDEISVINDTDDLVERYCNVGANILYQRNTVGTHSAEYINSRPAAMAWLHSVLGGTYSQEYTPTGCTTEVVTVDLTGSLAAR